MNTINYYELAIADPYCTDPQFLDAVAKDEELQQIVSDAKTSDDMFKSFIVDVPKPSQEHMDFIHNIIDTPLETATVTSLNKRPFSGVKPYYAIAASFFIMTVSFFMFDDKHNYNDNLMDHALAHTHYGERFSDLMDGAPSLTRVNNKLALFGAKMTSVANITWASNCEFQGVGSSHIVYQDKENKVNVFLIPKTLSFKAIQKQFSNELLNGSITELKGGYLVVVAPKNSDIDNVSSKIKEQIEWDI